tara:strand:- start:305 stop:1384 length:1080 start_codon:yes stop_codon:yes gene_type:complete
MREHLESLKKENQQICVGWVLQDLPNVFINGFSQNLMEYYYVSLDAYGIKQFCGYSVADLQKQAEAHQFKQVLVINQGIVFYDISEFMTNISKFESIDNVIEANTFKDDIIDFNVSNSDNLSKLTEILNLQVSFVANTEQFKHVNTGNTFTKLITSSGGLNPILYPWSLNMTNGATVDVVDISNIALVNAQRWVREWNGTDCLNFVNMLIDSTSVDGVTFITRGGAHKHRMQKLLDEQDGFAEWYRDKFSFINYNFRKHDFFNSKENDKLIESVKNNIGNVYIHLSNIYHYQATAFYYNLESRVAMQNDFINKIKINNLGSKVMITYIDAQHQTSPKPVWVDDIELIELLPRYKVFPWQ